MRYHKVLRAAVGKARADEIFFCKAFGDAKAGTLGSLLDCLDYADAHYAVWLDNNKITTEAAWTRAHELAAGVFTRTREFKGNSGVAITGDGVNALITRAYLPSCPLVAAGPEEWAKLNLCQSNAASDVADLLDHAATFGGVEGG